MSRRIDVICAHLTRAEVFADIGCDHGYCTQYMLENGLCGRAYLSDISAGSLQKAETLLADYVAAGKCFAVCADGLTGIPEPCDLVLIAGMGGEEIVNILARGELPARFVLQPMKNSEKVREFLLSRGAKILKDFTFADGKYYDLIVGERSGGERYSDFELLFGRDNLLRPSEDFLQKLRKERRKLRGYAGKSLRPESRAEISRRLRYIEEVLDAVEGDL